MKNNLYDLCQVVKDSSTVTQSVVVEGTVERRKKYYQVGILYKDAADLNERLAHLLLTGEAIDYKPEDVGIDSPKKDFNKGNIESLQNVIGSNGGSISSFSPESPYQFKEFKLSGNTHNIELHEFLKVPLECLEGLGKLFDKHLGNPKDLKMGIWQGHFEINPRNVFYSIK